MIDYHQTTTEQILEIDAQEHPDITAVIQGKRRLSYSELNEQAGAFAEALVKMGIKKGDRVGIWMENYAEWVVAWFGIARAGAITIPMDFWYKPAEAQFILGHSGAKAAVVSEGLGKIDFMGMLKEIHHSLPELKHIIAVRRGKKFKDGRLGENGPEIHDFNEMLAGNRDWRDSEELKFRRTRTVPGDVAFILYTSGTTGKPKGAMLTHRNICTNARAIADVLELTPKDNTLIPVPFSHCFGCVIGLTTASAAGCSITPMFAFDPTRELELIEKERVTNVLGVPTMFIRMLSALEKKDFDTSSLRTGVVAGAPCPEDAMEEVMHRMGCNITIAYGLTEASPVITMTRMDDPVEKRVKTVGRPIPEVEVQIVDDYNTPLSPGEVGELCCRGPNVMKGYYHDPVKTAEAIDGKGWLHSGDLAVQDEDGYYAIVGRKKDMVIVGGFNVYPAEIEDYLISFPDIVNVAVIGVPDHDLGDVVCAVIEPEPDSGLTGQAVVDRCYGKMASAKVPRYVVFMDSIPVSGRGKVQKFKLRDEITKRIRAGEVERLVPTTVKKGKERK